MSEDPDAPDRKVESSYGFVTIQNGADDYGAPIYTWAFTTNPFITPTMTPIGTPTPIVCPYGNQFE